VVFGQGNIQGVLAMDVEPLISQEPTEVPHLQEDKVMQHVDICLQELAKDRLDGEIEMENLAVLLQLMMPPSMEKPLEMGYEHEGITLQGDSRQTGKFFKTKLKMLLEELNEKYREFQIL